MGSESQHVQCRQFWVDERPHSTLFQCFNERRTAWQFRPQEKEEWRKFIHVREVLPGEICITREELRAALWKSFGDLHGEHSAAMQYVEIQLFPEGTYDGSK